MVPPAEDSGSSGWAPATMTFSLREDTVSGIPSESNGSPIAAIAARPDNAINALRDTGFITSVSTQPRRTKLQITTLVPAPLQGSATLAEDSGNMSKAHSADPFALAGIQQLFGT